MAYPGEHEHKTYQDYVIEKQSQGEQPKSKDEWRKEQKGTQKTSSIKPLADDAREALQTAEDRNARSQTLRDESLKQVAKSMDSSERRKKEYGDAG